MTGIPAERLSGSESERLRGLADYLSARVIGQCEAVEKDFAVDPTLPGGTQGRRASDRRLHVRRTDGRGQNPAGEKSSPNGSSTRNKGLIRIDMSEYSEKHNVARLIGSPPGYVGYGEADSSPKRYAAIPIRSSLFERNRKPTPKSSTPCCRSSTRTPHRRGFGGARSISKYGNHSHLNVRIAGRGNTLHAGRVQHLFEIGHQQKAPQSEYRGALEETFAPEFLNRIDDIVILRTLDSRTWADHRPGTQRAALRTDRLGYKVRNHRRGRADPCRHGFTSANTASAPCAARCSERIEEEPLRD